MEAPIKIQVLDTYIKRLENSFSRFLLYSYIYKNECHNFIFECHNKDLIDILFMFTAVPFQFQINQLLVKENNGNIYIHIILVQTTNHKLNIPKTITTDNDKYINF